MKKMFFLAATTVLALSSCSSEDVASENVVDNGLVPVTFDAPYLTSRATDKLELSGLQTRGFGVFAYEQGTLDFDQYYPTALTPNFMSDEKVSHGTSGKWEYSPIKYWSNNAGAKASFFAYAPHQTNSANTLKDASTTQSPRLVLHGRYNGPAIYYKVPETLDGGIDLCWGDFNNTGHAAVDLVKPGYDDKILFNFKHALSRISFNAQLWVDEVRPEVDHSTESSATHSKVLADGTTITIKSLKLVGNMATEGYLRLYDGKWDAQVSATKTLEMGNYFSGGALGSGACKYIMVNNTNEQALFGETNAGDMDNYFMTIPGGSFKVQVEYEVKTTDSALDGGAYTRTVKQISDQPYTLVAGKSYQFHLNLGMTSAKFTATVSDWQGTTIEEVDLPNNLPMVKTYSVKEAKGVAGAPTDGSYTNGDLWYNGTKLLKYNGSAWDDATEADCPAYIYSSSTYYKHGTGVTYTSDSSVTSVNDSCTSLEAAKNDAVNKNANGWYLIGDTLYYIQVK